MLDIQLQDWNGNNRGGTYKYFALSDASQRYKLQVRINDSYNLLKVFRKAKYQPMFISKDSDCNDQNEIKFASTRILLNDIMDFKVRKPRVSIMLSSLLQIYNKIMIH